MTVREDAVQFGCGSDTLLGIASLPAAPATLGVVVVVGGPQYRAGSHRQFVQLARSLAAGGVAVLRFDVRGMGDSEGTPRSFEQVSDDIGAAVDALVRAAPTLRHVVLWGLCDGASAALLYLDRQQRDARVAGLCLVNPWVRSETTLARTHVRHYYRQRLGEPAFWRKLLRGGVALDALRDLARSLALSLRRQPADQDATQDARQGAEHNQIYTRRMARQWKRFDGPILLLLSGDDYTAKEFLQAWATDGAWAGAAGRASLQRVDLPGADHTLSGSSARLASEQALLQWLQQQQTPARQPVLAA